MKTALKVILIGVIMLALTSFTVMGYTGECAYYIVSREDGEYLLTDYSDGTGREIFSSTEISGIIEYINSLNMDEAGICFADVKTSEGFELKKGKYIISGSLSFSEDASLTVSGAELVISDASLSFESGGVRVKKGSGSLESGEIYSETSAIRLDYSSDAAFYLYGGVVSAQRTAMKLDYGRCIILGGEVRSISEAAIESKSTLFLAGAPKIEGWKYGISTTAPITLSYDELALSSFVSIRYDTTFEDGAIKCVFYEADERSIDNITFFDAMGEKLELRYFSEHKSIEEKSFGAVYLPFKVNFFCEDELIKTEEVLSGEAVQAFLPGEKSGYRFSSWSIDAKSEVSYDFAQNVNKDFNLYAKYALLPPSFVLNSIEFTYDTLDHEFGIEELSHPLLSEGIVNYSWYHNGEYVSSSGPKFTVRDVKESGSYECKLDFTYGVDTVSVTTPPARLEIHKQKVKAPSVNDKYYNGSYQSAEIYSTSLYTVSEAGGIPVGVYPVRITLCDSDNYEFEDGSAVAFSEFKIIKAENRFTDTLKVTDIYEGMMPSPSAVSCFGVVEYLYSKEYDSGYEAVLPTEPGMYYCIAYVPGCENYTELYSAPVRFFVEEERAVGISIVSMPNILEYYAFDKFVPSGISIKVTYNSKRVIVVGEDKLTYSYQSADSFRYGDNAVIASYNELSIPVSVTVEKAKYDISQIAFQDASLVYDGTKKTLSYIGDMPTGLDGISLGCSISGGGVDVGVYPMTLTFFSESSNYSIPPAITSILTVLPYESEVVFTDTEFVYDGAQKCPTAYYTDVHGRKVALAVSGARSLAGEYTAEAFCEDKNYKLLNSSIIYKIAKADYDLSNLSWSCGSFTYDGVEKSVTLLGLPDGVSVIGYTDNKATSAGQYVAQVTLAYDERNYNAPSGIFFEWEIKKADYDTSLFSFSDARYVFNGVMQYPVFSGNMPTGIDGIRLEYRFSDGPIHVSEGKTAVEISFFSKSANYNLPENMQAYVEILPLGISAVWQHTEFTYNGNSHAPTATASESRLSVVGSARDAGSYTATAISLNTDYYVINQTVDFIINKAENSWTVPLSSENVYEGKGLSHRCEALAGEVVFLYYSDAEGNCEIDPPTLPGKYYVRAVTLGDKNHKDIASGVASFEIIKVVPVKLNITMHRLEYSAFELIDFSDFFIEVENNDGSCFLPSSEDVVVSYSASDSLRFGDTRAYISCMGMSYEIALSVVKAEYDMSGVTWSESLFEYDGEEKQIVLLGLPDGVRVKAYHGGKGKHAGEYPAGADLEYDSYNYNPPALPTGVLKIRKQGITPPILDALVYNGSKQYPNISKSELYSAVIEPGAAVGIYPVSLSLSDPQNYEFAGGASDVTVYYEIEPKKITLKVFDADKYLLESMDEPGYRIEEGYIFEGDSLLLKFVYTDDEISCVSENPNYLVTVIPGQITNHNTLSEDGLFLAFLIIFLILTVALICVVTVRHRDRILRYVSVLKCRLSPITRTENAEAEKACDCIESDTENFSEEEEIKAEIDEVDLEVKEESQIELKEDEEITLHAYSSMENTLCVDREHADGLITDSLAKNLLAKNDLVIETTGTKKRVINVDTLSENFSSGDMVDVNILKDMSLIPYDTAYIKVLARGIIDKPLRVYANDFSLSAVKMIALTGGEAVRVITVKKK